MFEMPLNEKTVTLKLKRIDVCDLILAMSSLANDVGSDKWKLLHDKLRQILDDFDKGASK